MTSRVDKVALLKAEDRRIIETLLAWMPSSPGDVECEVIERDVYDDDEEGDHYFPGWLSMDCNGNTIQVQRELVAGKEEGAVKGFSVELWWSEDRIVTGTDDEERKMVEQHQKEFVNRYKRAMNECKRAKIPVTFRPPDR